MFYQLSIPLLMAGRENNQPTPTNQSHTADLHPKYPLHPKQLSSWGDHLYGQNILVISKFIRSTRAPHLNVCIQERFPQIFKVLTALLNKSI